MKKIALWGVLSLFLFFSKDIFQSEDYLNSLSLRRVRHQDPLEEEARILLEALKDNPGDPLFFAHQLIYIFLQIKNPQLKEEILQFAVINLFSHGKPEVRDFALISAYKIFSSIDREGQKTNLLLKAVPLSIDEIDPGVANDACLLVQDKVLELKEIANQEKVLELFIRQFGETYLNERRKGIAEVLERLSKKLERTSLENLSAVLLQVLLNHEYLRPDIKQWGPEFNSLFPSFSSLKTFLSILGMLDLQQPPQADLRALLKSKEKIKPVVLLWLYELNLEQEVNKFALAERIVDNFSDQDNVAYKALSFYALARLSLPKNTPKELKSKLKSLLEKYTAHPYLGPLAYHIWGDIS
ncbi:MAG: hypothetical protein NC920_01025 [Candidatus Omnitrophica bacterium]|nr:hypothetical protein [Candidatus Omnitrophota bacterium]MCM8799100.1 hypothetical protein [Candidatus Omnitrophota bacterium]